MIFEDPGAPAAGACPFCGLPVPAAANQCPRCGTLLGEAAEDAKRLGARERALLRSRKATADTLFLVGLLLGGPMATLGGRFQLGSFAILGGGVASVLRRYTDWSLPGIMVIASLLAGVTATVVLEPAHHALEVTVDTEDARRAYVAALDARDPDVHVEGRGAAVVAVWFTLPHSAAGSCGSYPSAEVRSHLAELGFLRVVVVDRNAAGGLCSFAP